MRFLLENGRSAEESIDPIISKQFVQISLDESIADISKIIGKNRLVIVFEGGVIHGIITKIDLLTHYSK